MYDYSYKSKHNQEVAEFLCSQIQSEYEGKHDVNDIKGNNIIMWCNISISYLCWNVFQLQFTDTSSQGVESSMTASHNDNWWLQRITKTLKGEHSKRG